jgi:hypothetical protein
MDRCRPAASLWPNVVDSAGPGQANLNFSAPTFFSSSGLRSGRLWPQSKQAVTYSFTSTLPPLRLAILCQRVVFKSFHLGDAIDLGGLAQRIA